MNEFIYDLADMKAGDITVTMYCAPADTPTGWRFTAYLHFPVPPNTPGMCYASKGYKIPSPNEAINDALNHVKEMEDILSATLAKIRTA
jgi:hypothetical protein